jgi:NADH:ubiquinone oxidoreductase subunit 2 (subunit N)
MLSSIIGIVSVLGVILSMFYRERSPEAKSGLHKNKLMLIISIVLIFGLGIYPSPAIDWVKKRIEVEERLGTPVR